MAVRADVWLSTVHNGLDEARKRREAEFADLIAGGEARDEAVRKVYFPWKTREEYERMKRDYEATFGGG